MTLNESKKAKQGEAKPIKGKIIEVKITEGKPIEEKPTEEKTTEEGNKKVIPDDRLIWTKDETRGQIRILENLISVAYKQHVDEVNGDGLKAVRDNLENAKHSFSNNDLVEAQDYLIKSKTDLSILISKLSGWKTLRRWRYIFSIWGIVPLSTAIIAMFISFLALLIIGTWTIMDVPVWAPFIAVIGGSVQIFVGVVADYKADGMITVYKRLWYIVIPFASFALGFIAYLLIVAGLLNISQGQITLNQAVNQTIKITTEITTPTGNQTITKTTSGIVNNLAIPMIVCFLAGYATDWFIGMLGKLAPKPEAEKQK